LLNTYVKYCPTCGNYWYIDIEADIDSFKSGTLFCYRCEELISGFTILFDEFKPLTWTYTRYNSKKDFPISWLRGVNIDP